VGFGVQAADAHTHSIALIALVTSDNIIKMPVRTRGSQIHISRAVDTLSAM